MPRKPSNIGANDPFLRLSDIDIDDEDLLLPSSITMLPADSVIAAQIHQTNSLQEQNQKLCRIYERMEEQITQLLTTIQTAKTDTGLNSTPGLIPKPVGAEIARRLTKLEYELFAYEAKSVWISVLDGTPTSSTHTVQEEFITVTVYPNSVHVYLPYLPKQYHGNMDMLHHLLHKKISTVSNFPRWTCWTASFYIVYPESTQSFPRDVDNYNYKKVIDTLAESLYTNDNAYHFSFDKITSVFTDKTPPGVYIEITPKSSENPIFEKWQTPEIPPSKNRKNSKQ